MSSIEKNEKRETLADIVAEMRSDAEVYHDAWLNDPNDSPESDAVSNVLANYARSIEAAWKRDEERAIEHATRHAEAVARDNCRDCIHNPNGKNYEPVGNAAATYAALVKIHDLTNALDEECGVDPVEIRDIARTALSAPARNCDVMSRSICMKHFSTIYEGNRDGLCDVQTEREKNIHLYYIKFNKWLFAPAAERKGDGDGR